jgi:hypothetical protein
MAREATNTKGPKQYPPGRLFRELSKHELDEIIADGEGRARRSILQDSIKDVQHIRSEVKLDTFVNSALLCFTEGLVLRITTQLGTTRLSVCNFFSTGCRSIIYTVKLV